MGNTDSKLLVRQQISKLCTEHVSPDYKGFWSSLWKYPSSADEISNLICTTQTIRNLLDKQPSNFDTLFLKVSGKLLDLVAAAQISPAGTNEATQLLNCARILTRLVPFVFEHENEDVEQRLLWFDYPVPVPLTNGTTPTDPTTSGAADAPPTATAPLGHLLVKAALDLCVLPGLCAPIPDDPEALSKKQVWRPGIGRSEPAPSGFESQRTEAVRLLFAITSKRLYSTPKMAANQPEPLLAPFLVRPKPADVPAAVAVDKQELLTLICSLLNTYLTYSPPGWIPYMSAEPFPEELAGLCARWIACMALEISVDEAGKSTNAVRFYLGKLHRHPDHIFLCSNLARLLATFAKPDGWTTKFTHLGEETLAILWIVLSSNRLFMEHLIESEHLQASVFALLCAVLRDLGPNTSQTGAARVAVNILHLLSVEPTFCERISGFMGLPGVLPGKIGTGITSIGDAIVVTVAHSLLRATKGRPIDGMVEQLVLILANLSPYLKNLGVAAAQRIVKMLARVSEPAFLFGAQWNWRLLAWTVETADNLLRYSFDTNVRVAYALLVDKNVFDNIANMTFSEGVERAEQAAKGAPANAENGDDEADGEAPSSLELSVLKGKEKEHDIDDDFWKAREGGMGWVPSRAWWDSWFPFLPSSTLTEALKTLEPVVDEAVAVSESSDAAILAKMRSSVAKSLFEPRALTVRPYAPSVQADVWMLTWVWAISFAKAGGGSIGQQQGTGGGGAVPSMRPWNGTRPTLFPVVRG